MKDKTPPSLRQQIIEAIKGAPAPDQEYGAAECLFDHHIMPVLQKAMDAGTLLVGRNTKDRVPVHKAVMSWLESVVGHVMMIRTEEATISRRQLLKIIYQFGDNAERALADAAKINQEMH